ncbi:MAG: DNA-directed polymerase [Solirubrobacterales bacterium]|nr:DNA-directed polymerase [Solirubrobacterales bacterium]
MSTAEQALRVAHLDADAFYVSIELRRHPELRGRPVIVAGSGPRAVVTTASYEARRYGVGSAMPASRARRLCPDAVVLAPDFATYRAASKQVMDLVRAHVERVEVVGLDEAYLDVAGLFSPRAAMRRLLVEIKAATQLTCSVGIGPNKLVAKVASDAEKPAGFVVLSREQACARFASAPPGLVPGIGPKTAARLAELGLTTLAALGAAPEHALVERFGANLGPELGRRGRFEHDGEIGAARKVVSESRERTFDSDLSDPTQMREQLSLMAEELCSGLAAHGRRGRTIAIKVRLDDWTTVTRAHTIAEPTCDAQQVSAIALRLLREYAPARPVRLLGVRVAGLGAAHTDGMPRATPQATPADDPRDGGEPADQLALPV